LARFFESVEYPSQFLGKQIHISGAVHHGRVPLPVDLAVNELIAGSADDDHGYGRFNVPHVQDEFQRVDAGELPVNQDRGQSPGA
jgi:hypothetical protein